MTSVLKHKTICLSAVGFLLSASIDTHAADVQTMSDHQRLSTTISTKDINRISVQGDRIHQVFHSSQQLAIQQDDENGQLFVRCIDGASRTPIMLTIVTESGVTQDLKLVPASIEATTLILKAVGQKAGILGAVKQVDNALMNHKDEMLRLIKGLVNEGTLAGQSFTLGSYKSASLLIDAPFKVNAVRYWKTDAYICQEYRVHNSSAVEHRLTLSQVVQPGDIAVACSLDVLKGGQSAVMFVICQNKLGSATGTTASAPQIGDGS